jgi:RNA polymerase sigma-70 factor (ECF subfamily)
MNEIIEKCLKGNREAQYRLYEHFAAQMLGVCYRYTRSMEDAEDVLQEGFIKVFKNLHQYRNHADLSAWIRKIMVNTALTYLNKHNRYKKEMLIDDIAVHPISDDNPEVKLNAKELADTIRELPLNYQTIFNLIAIEGYNYDEVCNLLELNINTARSQYSRARTMLINLLKKKEQLPKENYAGNI